MKPASGVSLRKVDWFAMNDVLIVDAIMVPDVRWRIPEESLKECLLEDESVAHVNVICDYFVGLDLS